MEAKISRVDKKRLKEKVTASIDHASMATNNAALIAELTTAMSTLMDEKLKKVTDKLSTLISQNEQRFAEVEERVSTAEDTIETLQTKVTGLETKLQKNDTDLETKLKKMSDKLMDLESRSRRDNLKIINLKEGIEGTDPKGFLESMLPSLLSLQTTKGTVKIDRAHRVGKPGDKPRAMILKLHNSDDKDRIMRVVKTKKPLVLDGVKLSIFPDLPPAIREQRQTFNEVCEALINKKIRFRMKYPATLCFTHGDKEHSFETPDKAQAFLNTLK